MGAPRKGPQCQGSALPTCLRLVQGPSIFPYEATSLPKGGTREATVLSSDSAMGTSAVTIVGTGLPLVPCTSVLF